METCYRHPSRETGVSCSSCGRPICTDCMTPTPVGMRCPECARQRTKVRTAAAITAQEPRVAYAIIAANVLAFVAQIVTSGGARARSGALYENGALFGPLVDQGEWWRLVTSGFLHADPIHLLFNMVGVYFLGQLLEPALGGLRFAALYFTSLLAGSFGALLLSPDAVTVGASGAVFGMLGAAFLIMRQRGMDPMQTFIGPILILNVIITFAFPNISIGGHLGGLAGGMLCAVVIAYGERRRSLGLALAGCAAIAVLAAVGAVTAAGTPSLY
jgi:membrane associated rhomboid family serine protease